MRTVQIRSQAQAGPSGRARTAGAWTQSGRACPPPSPAQLLPAVSGAPSIARVDQMRRPRLRPIPLSWCRGELSHAEVIPDHQRKLHASATTRPGWQRTQCTATLCLHYRAALCGRTGELVLILCRTCQRSCLTQKRRLEHWHQRLPCRHQGALNAPSPSARAAAVRQLPCSSCSALHRQHLKETARSGHLDCRAAAGLSTSSSVSA